MQWTVDAILFDIDGTLVDSTAAVERTWRTWAQRYGLDAEAILAVCHGRRTEDTVAEFLPESQRPEGLAEAERLDAADLDGVVALPGTAALLDALPHHRWAAVTSGSKELMTARLAACGLPAPEVLIAASDVSAGKPDPQGYLKAASALGYPAGRCLVIEDAPAGLGAGRASGAAVLAVATSHPASELGGADATIADLTALRVSVFDDGLLVETR